MIRSKPQTKPKRCAHARARLQELRHWQAIHVELFQVELHGRFSTQRIQAIDDYCLQKNLLHALLVCVGMPLPALITITCLDGLPLVSPTEGSNANYVFWIRTHLCLMILTVCAVQFFRFCLPSLPGSKSYLSGVVFVASSVSTGFVYGLSLIIGFPVPFVLVLASIPVLPAIVLPLLAVWRQTLQEHPETRTAMRNQLFAFAGQTSMTYAYALYFFAFTSLTPFGQSLFIFMLPSIKICLKSYLSRILRRLDDVKPAFVVFNV